MIEQKIQISKIILQSVKAAALWDSIQISSAISNLHVILFKKINSDMMNSEITIFETLFETNIYHKYWFIYKKSQTLLTHLHQTNI